MRVIGLDVAADVDQRVASLDPHVVAGVQCSVGVIQCPLGGDRFGTLCGDQSVGVVQRARLRRKRPVGLHLPGDVAHRPLTVQRERACARVLKLATVIGRGLSGDRQVVCVGCNQSIGAVERASNRERRIGLAVLVNRPTTVDQIARGRDAKLVALDLARGVVQ